MKNNNDNNNYTVEELHSELEAIQQQAARIKAAINSLIKLEGLVNSIATKGENHE